jgi:hypothetical protein
VRNPEAGGQLDDESAARFITSSRCSYSHARERIRALEVVLHDGVEGRGRGLAAAVDGGAAVRPIRCAPLRLSWRSLLDSIDESALIVANRLFAQQGKVPCNEIRDQPERHGPG